MPKIDIRLKPPILLRHGYFALFLITGVFLLCLPILFWIKLILFIIGFFYSRYILQHAILSESITLQLRDEGWIVLNKTGAHFVDLLGESVVMRWIIVFRFRMKLTQKILTIIISKDRLSAADYRKLIAHARAT